MFTAETEVENPACPGPEGQAGRELPGVEEVQGLRLRHPRDPGRQDGPVSQV